MIYRAFLLSSAAAAGRARRAGHILVDQDRPARSLGAPGAPGRGGRRLGGPRPWAGQSISGHHHLVGLAPPSPRAWRADLSSRRGAGNPEVKRRSARCVI